MVSRKISPTSEALVHPALLSWLPNLRFEGDLSLDLGLRLGFSIRGWVDNRFELGLNLDEDEGSSFFLLFFFSLFPLHL